MRLGRLAAIIGLIGALLLATAAHGAVNDPFLDKQWGLPMIGAPDAWATGTGAGVTIAVVDTGVHLTHEDLAAKVVPGTNLVDRAKPPQDDHGHGSHAAGIAAAATNNRRGVAGVAPDAKIMPIKVLDHEGKGTAEAVAEGIRYAADHGAAVINLSLGDNGQGGVGLSALLGPSFAAAIRDAWAKGAIPVVSAGNHGDPNSAFITSSSFSNEPALVVTSLDRAGAKPAYAATVGRARWGIAAPGGNGDLKTAEENILSAWWGQGQPNVYAYAAGTSMAAPHVAGAAAVLRGLGLTPQQTVDRLLATARDIGPAGDDSTFGHGALDVKAAVAGLTPVGPGSTATTGTTAKPGGGSTATTAKSTTPGKGAAGAGTGVITTLDQPAGPGGEDTSGGGAGQADGDDDEGVEESAAPDRPSSSAEERPWPALVVALLTLLGAVALLAGVVRPKPI